LASGERYVAGGAALNELTGGTRLSRDIDVFHDTDAAVAASWDADRRRLEGEGLSVRVIRERPSYVEAEIASGAESVRMEWARDSAFRFFPLVEHADLGLVLHPFDLTTNKVLALVGRLEVRDWVDVIHCGEHVQPLGYLAWAASGKDPGFGPHAILEQAARTSRYAREEVLALAFDGPEPDPSDLARRWRVLLDAARVVVGVLPPEEAGTAVLGPGGDLFTGDARAAADALSRKALVFHRGRIGGALPQILP
jgi:hypothetical protein